MRRAIVLVAVLQLLVAGELPAQDTTTRVVSPVMDWFSSDLERFDPAWFHVKFVEGSSAVWRDGRFADDSEIDMSPVNVALSSSSLAEVRSTFSHDRATLREWKARGEARSGVIGPDLSLWFDVRVTGGRSAVADLINRLNDVAAVEIAHPAPVVELAATHTMSAREIADPRLDTPDFSDMQDYLFESPVGLEAPSAWSQPGGRGQGMKFIDVELAWTPDHEDFDYERYFYEGGAPMHPDPIYESHGTAVVGEVVGRPNGFGITGFASDVSYGVVAISISEFPSVSHHFQEAVDNLDAGDTWLIELQMFPPGHSATPLEWLQVNYDVIWNSVWALGIICVEAAGNGGQNLDHSEWGGVFDRNVRDSGAIMVGAGTPTGLVAESFSNYGSRMDSHAWGSEIVTTGWGDLHNGGSVQTRYTATFGGTSGASPMIVGSALALQGIALAEHGIPLDPIAIRTILTDTGIPNNGTRYIGPRPNLVDAVQAVLNSTVSTPETAPRARLRVAAFPNPFRTQSEIRFTLSNPGEVRLELFDATGRHLRTLLDQAVHAGEVSTTWDGRNDAGRDLGSGTYFYRMEIGGRQETGRLVRLR